MIKKNWRWLLVLIAAIVLQSCNFPRATEKKDINCPLPVQNCLPKKWSGSAVDTSAEYRKIADNYYVIEPVKRINSPENEWGLCFISDKKAILTFTDTDLNRAMITRFPTENMATMESGLGIPIEGNMGAMSFRDGKIAFAAAKEEGLLGNSDIYTAELSGNILTKVKNLGKKVQESPLTWDSHPAFSPDGNVIFFASDRFFGTGQIDLWYIIKQSDGSWSEPVNCGEIINTDCDELTPFISPDGKNILFASSGHQGVGGYDIFRSKISNSFWADVKEGDISKLMETKGYFSTPENLRPPLNTKADELFPSSPGDFETLLYYSSNQSANTKSVLSTKGGYDLYVRKMLKKYIAKKDTVKKETVNFDTDVDIVDVPAGAIDDIFMPTFKLKGTVYNARTKQPAKNAELVIREIKHTFSSSSYAAEIINDTTGKYKVVELEKDREFEITAQSQDLYFESFKIKVENNDTTIIIETKDGEYIVELEKDREFEITAQAQDLFFESFKLQVDKIDTTNIVEKSFFVPEKLEIRLNFPSGKYDEPYKYTLDSNGVETNVTWDEEMDLLAKNILISQNILAKLIIIGHTDEVGSEKSNEILGLNRVKFVISELVKRGVPESLLEAKSMGETQPIDRKDGESLEQYRKRLRRVGLEKVLK